MVSTATIAAIIFTLNVCFLVPIGLAVYFYKKHKIYLPAILVGALAFAVTQPLSRIPLLQLLSAQDWYSQMAQNTILLALFLSLTAGLFEETGRFICFKYILKNKLAWKNGLAYGIGHGGFEAIAIVGLSSINNLVFTKIINSGQIDSLAAALPPETLNYLVEQLTTASPLVFMLGGIERIMVITIHLALSLVVLYGVRQGKNIYWLYAVLLHTLVNFPAVILQRYGLWVTEGLIFIMFSAALVFIVKSRRWFTDVTI
jgi:uncharacterized membrane protein YhfC